VPDRVKPSFELSGLSPERQCSQMLKNYKQQLNAVWHRNCTHMATEGVKGIM